MKLRRRFPKYIIKINKLVLNKDTAKWCQLPYYNHKNGCPKFNKDKNCPTKCKSILDVVDIKKPMYFIHSKFNLEKHVNKMKRLHPDWTISQCKCVLYWQKTSRKQLKNRVKTALKFISGNFIEFVPEAMGVNVYATSKINGLKLERIRDLKICKHIAMIGTKNETKKARNSKDNIKKKNKKGNRNP